MWGSYASHGTKAHPTLAQTRCLKPSMPWSELVYLAVNLPSLAGDDVGPAEDELAAYRRLPNTRSRRRRTLITSKRSPYVSESVSPNRANASCFAQA